MPRRTRDLASSQAPPCGSLRYSNRDESARRSTRSSFHRASSCPKNSPSILPCLPPFIVADAKWSSSAFILVGAGPCACPPEGQPRGLPLPLFCLRQSLLDNVLDRRHVHILWLIHQYIFDAVDASHFAAHHVLWNIGAQRLFGIVRRVGGALKCNLTFTREQPVDE